MSETTQPPNGADDRSEDTAGAPATDTTTTAEAGAATASAAPSGAAPAAAAIPLPPANAGQGSVYPSPGVHDEPAPTDPGMAVTPGAPTPPSGVWSPPPQSGWAPAQPGWVPAQPGWAPTGAPGPAYGAAWSDPSGAPPPPGGWAHPGYPYAPPPATPKKHTGIIAGVAAAVLVIAVVGGAGLGRVVWPVQGASTSASIPAGSGSTGGSGGATSPSGGGSSSSGSFPFGPGSSGGSSSGNSSTGAGAPGDISSIAAKVSPGLVDINTNLSYQHEQAAGTGMVLTSNGEVLTNNHVIDSATSISVTDVGNHQTYKGTVVGYDRTGDIAVVQLTDSSTGKKPSGLQTVSTNKTAAVGQAVVGVGNAGGTGGAPSAAGGSITALDQSITASDDSGGNSESLTGLIEINAGIEPGDSGGSLVNTSGEVIGMDTAASTGSSYQVSGTQAYAIPIATALSVAKQIEAGKSSPTIHIGATGFLGVSVQSSSSSASGGFGSGSAAGGGFGSGSGSGSGNATTSGAVVQGTLSGSPSANAGLVSGDVITGVDGKSVNSASDLSNLLEQDHPGDTVQLQWTDTSGQTQTASVTLTTGPPA